MRKKNLTQADIPANSYFTLIREERRPTAIKNQTRAWAFCRCKCGKEVWIATYRILSGNTKSCGCLCSKMISERGTRRTPTVVAEGSRLTVIGHEHRLNIRGEKVMWANCLCVCGKTKWIQRYAVESGGALSCGCLVRDRTSEVLTKHGMAESRAYSTWLNMKARCSNKKLKHYKNYGGRGILVCKEWWDDFSKFYECLAKLLPDGCSDIPCGLTIDRANNDRGYEPGNIRLATNKQQSRNTRRNRTITIDGVTRCVSEWGEVTGLGNLIASRLHEGWDEVDAVKTPKIGRGIKNARPKRTTDGAGL
jgi:hypothetical protein